LGPAAHPQSAHPNGQCLELGQVLKKEFVHATHRGAIAFHVSDLAAAVALRVGDDEVDLEGLELGEVTSPRLRLKCRNPPRVPILEYQLSRCDAPRFGYFAEDVVPEPAHGEVGLPFLHVIPAQLQVFEHAICAQRKK
ncbi:hypothetical protein B0T21DRAFT_257149, partial [Apiosordaria backusii]